MPPRLKRETCDGVVPGLSLLSFNRFMRMPSARQRLFSLPGPHLREARLCTGPAPVPWLPDAESIQVLRCGWSRANAWRQRARVYRRAQAKLVSKPRRLHQLAARHGVNPIPCSWMFGERWTPALICDAPNLHNRGRFTCSIDLQIRTATSMLFPMPTPFQTTSLQGTILNSQFNGSG
jgi:hypothetical protein